MIWELRNKARFLNSARIAMRTDSACEVLQTDRIQFAAIRTNSLNSGCGLSGRDKNSG